MNNDIASLETYQLVNLNADLDYQVTLLEWSASSEYWTTEERLAAVREELARREPRLYADG